MADPQAWAPPESDFANPSQQVTIGGHPVLIKPASPVKPEFIPGAPGQVLGPDNTAVNIPGFKPGPPPDKTTYRPMTPGEKTANHLSIDAPWQIGSTGEFKLPDGFKAASSDDTAEIKKQQNIDAADSLINGVHRARGYINDAFDIPLVGNTATGGGYNILRHSPLPTDASKLEGVINQEIRGNIFLKRIADLKESSDSPTGGTGIGRIMQAEIPLITGAIGTLDPGKMGHQETLKSLDQIERSALRSKAIFNGENPDDPAVAKKYGIMALPGQAAPPAAPSGSPPLTGGPSGGGTPPSGPPENPIANGGPGDMGPSLTPSGGETRSVIDPKKQALGQQIVSLVSKGADPNTIMGFAVGADPSLRGDPKFRAWVSQAIQYRQQHPNAKFSIDPGFYTAEVPLSEKGIIPGTSVLSERAIAKDAQTAPGAAMMNAGNAVTFGHAGDVVGDQQAADRALAVANAQHPIASLSGTMAGGATAAMGIESLLANLGLFSGGAEGLTELQTAKLAASQAAKRAAVADTAYGGIAGGTNAPQGQGLQNAGIGALLGLGGNVVGRGVTKGVASGLEGVTNPTVSYVAKEAPGALTIGQAVGQSGRIGKAVKSIEDNLSGLPLAGDAINARRTEGLQKMNSVAFDKALEPIGEKAGGKFGEEAVQHAQDAVGQAFTKALAGKSAIVDHGFIVDAAKAKNAIEALPDSIKGDVNNQVDHVINNYFDDNGQITGENLQTALQELGGIKRAYQGTPLGHRIGKAIDQLSDGVEGVFQRQAPEVMPQYNAAKQAFKRVSTLEDAVLRAKNESDGKNAIFTPAQLGIADRANTIKYGGKHAAAAGKGEFHDFQRAMQTVLPNKVPNSGTAGRVLVPLALIGAGTGGGALEGDTGKGLTLGALLSLAYSRTGQRALTSAVLKRGTGAQAAGQAVRKSARVVGHAVGTQTALGASRE